MWWTILSFFRSRLLLYAIPILLALGGIGYGVYSMKDMEKQINDQKVLIVDLQSELESSYEYSEILKEENEKIMVRAEELIRIERKLAKEEKKSDALRNLLDKHDLTNLSKEKPELIENRINKGTKEVFKELEDATKL
jgi:hypothetical protein